MTTDNTPDSKQDEALEPPMIVNVTFCRQCGQTGLHNTRCVKCGGKLTFEDELVYSRASVAAVADDGSMSPEQLERAVLIAESRGIDLETARELVYLRDRAAAVEGDANLYQVASRVLHWLYATMNPKLPIDKSLLKVSQFEIHAELQQAILDAHAAQVRSRVAAASSSAPAEKDDG